MQDKSSKLTKALTELSDELNSFSDVVVALKDLKEAVVDSNEEVMATFVEGTKRLIKKEQKDETPAIKQLEKSTVLSLMEIKKALSEVERGVKGIKLPSSTDFRATGAMLKLPIKELTRAVKEQELNLSTDAKNPIAVRLSDGENFYKALENFIQQVSGGGATSYAFDKQGGSPTKAATVETTIGGKTRDALVVVNPDGTNIAGGSSGGGLTDAELRATPVPVSLTSTTITGNVAVTNAGLTALNGAISGTEVQVDVLTMPTTTVTATNLDIRDLTNTDVVTAELSAVDNAVLDTIAAKDFATQTTLAAINTKLVSGTDIGDVTINNTTSTPVPVQPPLSGYLNVSIDQTGNNNAVDVLTMPVVAVTQSGTWDEVGINDSGNSITVDYATTGSGTATGALRVELPTNGTGVIATVGAVTAITNALPAGTNAIGKLSANSGVDIGDVTLTAGTAAVGSILPPDTDVTAHTNYARKYYTNAGAVTDGIVWSPAAGKRWHVVTMYIQTSAAATITLEDDKAGGDDPVWKGEIAANSGVTLSFTEHYPMASGEDAADLLVTTSAGNVYITCVGYEI